MTRSLHLVFTVGTLILLVMPGGVSAQIETGDDSSRNCAQIEKLRLQKNIPGVRNAAVKCLESRESARTLDERAFRSRLRASSTKSRADSRFSAGAVVRQANAQL